MLDWIHRNFLKRNRRLISSAQSNNSPTPTHNCPALCCIAKIIKLYGNVWEMPFRDILSQLFYLKYRCPTSSSSWPTYTCGWHVGLAINCEILTHFKTLNSDSKLRKRKQCYFMWKVWNLIVYADLSVIPGRFLKHWIDTHHVAKYIKIDSMCSKHPWLELYCCWKQAFVVGPRVRTSGGHLG